MSFRNGTRQREPVHKPLEATTTTTTMGTPRMLKMTRNEKAADEDDAIAVLEDEALMEKASMAYK